MECQTASTLVAPQRLALALLQHVPAADGSDGPIPLDERTPHIADVVYSPAQHDGSLLGFPGDMFSEPVSVDGLLCFAIPGDPSVPAIETYQAYAVVDMDTGAALYVGVKATRAAQGKTVVLPVSAFRCFAEAPS